MFFQPITLPFAFFASKILGSTPLPQTTALSEDSESAFFVSGAKAAPKTMVRSLGRRKIPGIRPKMRFERKCHLDICIIPEQPKKICGIHG